MCHKENESWFLMKHIDGLMQEKLNSSAIAMELIFLALTHRYKLHQAKVIILKVLN